MFTWVLILAVGIIIGVALGVYLMRLDDEAKRTQQNLEQKLNKAHNDFQRYKAEVQDSYVTTAQLINQLTDSYKAVHSHLSQSAAHLCGDSAVVKQIPKFVDDTQTAISVQTPDTDNAMESAIAQASSLASGSIDKVAVEKPEDTSPGEPGKDTLLGTEAESSAKPSAVESASSEDQVSDSPTPVQSPANTSASSEHLSENNASENKETPRETGADQQSGNAAESDEQKTLANSSSSATKQASQSEEESEAMRERLKLEQARVEASRMIH